MARKRPLRSHSADGVNAQMTEDESGSDNDDGDDRVADSLLFFRPTKRIRNDDGSVMAKSDSATLFPEDQNGAAWLKSCRTLRSGRLTTPLVRSRRPLSFGKTNVMENQNLLEKGKSLFLWAFEKIWKPLGKAFAEDRSVNYEWSEERFGFTFLPGSTGKDFLSSSMLSENDVTSREASASRLNTPRGVRNDPTSVAENRNITPPPQVSSPELYFTPEGWPAKRGSGSTTHLRGILSPRSPGMKARGPRVCINRTPSVRVIASRADQKRDASSIWDHRDLDAEECMGYRVPGDATPESAEKPQFLSAIPITPSMTSLHMTKLPDEDIISTAPKTLEFPSTPEPVPMTNRSAAAEVVSPRTGAALALLDLAAEAVVAARPPISSFAKKNNYLDILAKAAEQQLLIKNDSSTPGKSPRIVRRRVSMASPYLPILTKRTPRRLISAPTPAPVPVPVFETRTPTTIDNDVRMDESKRCMKFPRLLPPLILARRERPKLVFERPPRVAPELCRPVEEMLKRKRATPWLPPRFVEVFEEEEEEDNDMDDYDVFETRTPTTIDNDVRMDESKRCMKFPRLLPPLIFARRVRAWKAPCGPKIAKILATGSGVKDLPLRMARVGESAFSLNGSPIANVTKAKTDIEPVIEPCTPGDLFVFGNNEAGQLGLEDPSQSKVNPFLMTADRVGGHLIVQVVAGGMHSCIINEEGQAYTWGCDDEGALGAGVSDEDTWKPRLVSLPQKVKTATAGDSHTAFLTVGKRIYLTGTMRDANGAFGLKSKAGSSVQKMPFLYMDHKSKKDDVVKDVPVKISSGYNHFAVLNSKRDIYLMGDSSSSQVGPIGERRRDGGRTGRAYFLQRRKVLVRVGKKFAHFSDVWCTPYGTFVKLDDQDRWFACGNNMRNQLGFPKGDTEGIQEEWREVDQLAERSVIKIVGTQTHTIALTRDGALVVFGSREYLGLSTALDESLTDYPIRHPISDQLTFSDIACSSNNATVALTTAGDLYVWGSPSSSVVGTDEDEMDAVAVPKQINSKNTKEYRMVQVSVGGAFVLMVGVRRSATEAAVEPS